MRFAKKSTLFFIPTLHGVPTFLELGQYNFNLSHKEEAKVTFI